ncbi:membrane hypothetical protein [Desulfovibrionales bacterium]
MSDYLWAVNEVILLMHSLVLGLCANKINLHQRLPGEFYCSAHSRRCFLAFLSIYVTPNVDVILFNCKSLSSYWLILLFFTVYGVAIFGLDKVLCIQLQSLRISNC